MKRCTQSGCDRRYKARGFCAKHYRRWYRELRGPAYNNRYYSSQHGRYMQAKAFATRRHILWSLTKEEHAALLGVGFCYLCGGGLHKTGIGLDRMDPKAGYTFENCRPCCKPCNIIKGFRKSDEFVRWAKRIVRFQGKYQHPVLPSPAQPVSTKLV